MVRQSRLPEFRRFVNKHRFIGIAILESHLSQVVRVSGYTVLRCKVEVPSTGVLSALRNDLTIIHHDLTQSADNENKAATLHIEGLSFT